MRAGSIQAGPRLRNMASASDEYAASALKCQRRGCSNCNEWRTAGEAKGKFSDRDPIPFSFDMSTLNKIVSDSKSIQKSLKELGQSGRAEA